MQDDGALYTWGCVSTRSSAPAAAKLGGSLLEAGGQLGSGPLKTGGKSGSGLLEAGEKLGSGLPETGGKAWKGADCHRGCLGQGDKNGRLLPTR